MPSPFSRSSPSGKADGVQRANVVSAIGYTASAPLELVLIPASSRTGVYAVTILANLRAVAGGGSITTQYLFNAPRLSTIVFAPGAIALTGTLEPKASATRQFTFETGAAFRLLLTPNGVSGSPVVDVYGSAQLLALL